MSNQALIPTEERIVEFYEDSVIVVRLPDGNIYVPLRPIVEGLGLAWAGQRERLQRDPVLSEVAMSVSVTRTDIDPSSRRPRTSTMLSLPLEYISGFLFGVSARRVKPELKERVIRYQKECYRVLAKAFSSGELTSGDVSHIVGVDPAAIEALELARAVVRLAESHIRLSVKVNHHEQRLETIEATLGDPRRQLTSSQAAQIQDAVKSIAIHFSRRSGRNEYGSVWGEFHRKFEVNSYLNLPASRYDEAIEFLNDWLQSLISDVDF